MGKSYKYNAKNDGWRKAKQQRDFKKGKSNKPVRQNEDKGSDEYRWQDA